MPPGQLAGRIAEMNLDPTKMKPQAMKEFMQSRSSAQHAQNRSDAPSAGAPPDPFALLETFMAALDAGDDAIVEGLDIVDLETRIQVTSYPPPFSPAKTSLGPYSFSDKRLYVWDGDALSPFMLCIILDRGKTIERLIAAYPALSFTKSSGKGRTMELMAGRSTLGPGCSTMVAILQAAKGRKPSMADLSSFSDHSRTKCESGRKPSMADMSSFSDHSRTKSESGCLSPRASRTSITASSPTARNSQSISPGPFSSPDSSPRLSGGPPKPAYSGSDPPLPGARSGPPPPYKTGSDPPTPSGAVRPPPVTTGPPPPFGAGGPPPPFGSSAPPPAPPPASGSTSPIASLPIPLKIPGPTAVTPRPNTPLPPPVVKLPILPPPSTEMPPPPPPPEAAPPPPPVEESLICATCGEPFELGCAFCIECGARLDVLTKAFQKSLEQKQRTADLDSLVGDCLQTSIDRALATQAKLGSLTEQFTESVKSAEAAVVTARAQYEQALRVLNEANERAEATKKQSHTNLEATKKAKETVRNLHEYQTDQSLALTTSGARPRERKAMQVVVTDTEASAITRVLSQANLLQSRELQLLGLQTLCGLFAHQHQDDIRATVETCFPVVEAVLQRQWTQRTDPQDGTLLTRIKAHALFLKHACDATRLLVEFEAKQDLRALPILTKTLWGERNIDQLEGINQGLPVLREWCVATVASAMAKTEFLCAPCELTHLEQAASSLRSCGVPEWTEAAKRFDLAVWCKQKNWCALLPRMLEHKICTLEEARSTLTDITLLLALGVALRDLSTFTSDLGITVKGAAEPVTPGATPQPLTLKEVVDRIKADLGLDINLGLIPALEEACTTLGVTGTNLQTKAAACAKMLVIKTNWPTEGTDELPST